MVTTPLEWLGEVIVSNTGTSETDPDVTQLSNGNYLITWTSGDNTAGTPGSPAGADIIGRIYSPLGTLIKNDFRLNTGSSSDTEQSSSIVALDNGQFVVTYNDLRITSGPPLTLDSNIWAEVYTDAGNVVGAADIIVNGPTGSSFTALTPHIDAVSSTQAFISWYNPDNGDVEGRFYNPSTGGVGAVRQLFSGATGAGEGIAGLEMAALTNNTYVVTWANLNSAVNDSIQFQIVNANGTTSGGDVTVSNALTSNSDPNIAALSDGQFVITWTGDNTGGTNSGVRGRLYNADGSPASGEFTPPTTLPDNQNQTAVAAIDNGEFVIFWADEGTFDLHGQRFSTTGAKIGGEFDVENFTSTELTNIEATGTEDGRVIITWQAEFSNGSNDDIYQAIWDPRDNTNSPDSNGNQIGTTQSDTFDVEAGALRVYGYNGNDRISVDAVEVNPAVLFDGGIGTDVLVIEDVAAGTWDFRGETVQNFEEIEFAAELLDVNRTARFNANQLDGVTIFDFDGGTGSNETLQIYAGALTTLDYSSVVVQTFDNGTDLISYIGDSSSETITGTNVSESFFGSFGGDVLNGLGGDDVFLITDDNAVNTVNGGTGLDTLSFIGFSEGVSLNLTSTNASGTYVDAGTTTNYTGIANLIGSSFADVLQGNASVRGGAGNDVLRGRGNNLVEGESGNDELRLDDLDGTPDFDGGLGIDTFSTAFLNGINMYVELGAGYRKGSIVPGAFNGTLTDIENYSGDTAIDIVIGSAADNIISTSSGNDRIDGGAGNDTMNAGSGDDVMLHSIGSDAFNGSVGFDTADYSGAAGPVVVDLLNSANNALAATGDTHSSIEQVIGSTNTDTIRGSNAANTLVGNGGDDVLEGNGGNDLFFGGSGNDTFNGGAGSDTVDYTAITQDLVFNLDAGFFNGPSQTGSDTLISIENVLLGSGDDRIFAGAAGNTVTGNGGNDVLSGQNGNDNLSGGTGDDEISGGGGIDTLTGGSGNDRIFGNNDNDIIEGGSGDDLINGGAGDDFVNGGDSDDNAVVGGTGNDEVRGGAGNDGLNGSDDDDEVYGEAGDDRVFGGTGVDLLEGGIGNDTLGGGDGVDTMNGGDGNDGMNGNVGNDIMDGGNGSDTMFGSEGNDVINGGANDAAGDLLIGQGGLDTFVFEGNWGTDRISRYGELVQGGPRTFNEVIDMSGTAATGFADLQVAQIGNSTFVNINGDAVNSIEILFQSAADITAADFIF